LPNSEVPEKRILTLGVVGVVGVFVAKIVGHFGGHKGAKIHREAPICSSSQLSAMAVLSSQKVSAKKCGNFEIFSKTYLTLFAQ